jgi:hypothetical protein
MEKTTIDKLVLTDEELEETEQYFQDLKVEKEINTQKLVQHDKTLMLLEKFDNYLLQSIEEGLLVLGEPIKNTIFLTLEFEFNIKKPEIPKKIGDFSIIFRKIIGLGANRVESLFITQLITKLGIDVHDSTHEANLIKWLVNEISFTDYIFILRKEYIGSKNNQ